MSVKTTEEVLRDIFADLDGRPDFPVADIRERVAIISTPRCGSSMFCDILHNTGKVGETREWFNRRYMQAYAELFGKTQLNLNEYLNFVVAKTTVNGVFSVNFHIDQYRDMQSLKFNVMDLQFTRIYYLRRRDKVAQAWSLAKAWATDQWSADTKARQDAVGIGGEQALKALSFLYSEEAFYRKHLAIRVQRELDYEDFSRLESTSVFRDVLADLGVEELDGDWFTSLEKQGGREEDEGLKQFREWLQPSQR